MDFDVTFPRQKSAALLPRLGLSLRLTNPDGTVFAEIIATAVYEAMLMASAERQPVD